MGLVCLAAAELPKLSIRLRPLSSAPWDPTLRRTPGIGTPPSTHVVPRAASRRVAHSESSTTGQILPMPAPRVALNSLRLPSAGRCRVWRQDSRRDATEPGQSLPERKASACLRLSRASGDASCHSVLRFERVHLPGRPPPWRFPRPRPENGGTPRATGRAGYPANKQAKHRLENGGLPMKRSNLLRAAPLDIVDSCQDQADQRNRRPDSPLRACRAVHHSYQEEQQGGGLRQDACQIQSWKLTNQQRHFAQGRKSKAAPPGKPKSEIARLVIAAEKKKEHQQDDRGRC